MIEYHGWVTLCCISSIWDDGRWREARDEVERQITHFKAEDGHWVGFAGSMGAIQTLQLSGYTESQVAPLLQLMEFVGRTVPDSYGELVVIAGDRPDLGAAVRYRLAGGRVSPL